MLDQCRYATPTNICCHGDLAHRHGVQCLGTIITEWKDGAILCSQLLRDERTVQQFVDQIVAITLYYNLDGWLINIENPINVRMSCTP